MFPHIAHHIRRETLRSHPSFDSSIFPSQLDFPVLDSSSYGNPFESGIWKPDWISPISASAVVDLHLPSLPYSLPEAYNLAANRGFDPPAPPPLQIASQMHLPTFGPGENRRLSLSLASNPSPSDIQAAGPLGPFTGYAAILKTSRFLKPAQQLLDEFCGFVTGSSIRKDSDSRPSFQKDDFGFQGSAGEARRPEFQQTKAKLLYMQEQVCRRYKQYQQQMQMVVSSFECVAGLSSATPYAALALRTVSKHFRCLKGVISDQLRRICSVLGDEPMPATAKAESSAGDASSLRRSHHPVWRPQRGLPERAVSVLRAWLFDHFLHPYPTDTDKHMLASQTGLSRNQVSNWFINARVRMWKPMVEEIHMLETKDAPVMDLNASEAQLGEAAAEVSACFGRKWHGEKRPRVEDCGADAGMMNFTCPPGIGIGIGGLDAVSLTLGLRQGEGIQQEGQMRHFGHHMLHDFVG